MPPQALGDFGGAVRLVLRSLPVGERYEGSRRRSRVALHDADGEIIDANAALANMVGANRDELIGRDVSAVLPEASPDLPHDDRRTLKLLPRPKLLTRMGPSRSRSRIERLRWAARRCMCGPSATSRNERNGRTRFSLQSRRPSSRTFPYNRSGGNRGGRSERRLFSASVLCSQGMRCLLGHAEEEWRNRRTGPTRAGPFSSGT